MDPLEEKIRKQFASIKTGNKELLETDIIHSIEVKEKIAYIQRTRKISQTRQNLPIYNRNKLPTTAASEQKNIRIVSFAK